VVVVLTALDSYQVPLLRGMHDVLSPAGLSVVAHVYDAVRPRVPDTLRCLLTHRRPRAVITTNAMSREQEQACAELVGSAGTPLVHIGQERADAPCVRADNRQGMTDLMTHLLDERGVCRPVLVRGLAHHPDHREREQVFRQETSGRGIWIDEELIIDGGSDLELTSRRMRGLLRRRRDMDAVVTMDDNSAIAVSTVLAESGLTVPQDTLVTGYDNYPIAALSWPGLTTVDQDLYEQGRTAARIVLDRLAGTPVPCPVPPIRCRVIVRGSTGPLQGVPDDGLPSAETVARIAKTHLTTQGSLLRLNRALDKCQSPGDVCTVLSESLPQFGITRAFLVLHDEPTPRPAWQAPRTDPVGNDRVPVTGPGPEPSPADPTCPDREDCCAHHRSRVVLDYREGRVRPAPSECFSSCDLLPEHLGQELARGFLCLQRLVSSSGDLGYLLCEDPLSPVPVAEPLRLDVGRTLDVLLRTRQVAEHSAMLERLVAARTRELRAEVASRRRAEDDLKRANRELERSLVQDRLTRIANRTAMDRHFEIHWERHVARHRSFAVLMMDVDLFKAYNDRYGHLMGDRTLRAVAACLSAAVLHRQDLVCRFGGEEFLVALPDSTLGSAVAVGRRFRELLAGVAIPHEASRISPYVTASLGAAAVVPPAGSTPEILIAAADRGLYQAKRQGRNCLAVGVAQDGCALPGPRPVGARPWGPQDPDPFRAPEAGEQERSGAGTAAGDQA